MTKAELRAYKDLRGERDKIKQQLDELETVLYGPKGQRLDGMPRGGSRNNRHIVDNLGDRHTELQQLYESKVAELDAKMLEIERAIEVLEPRERTLVRLHYFQGLTWEQVAVEINYSWAQTHRIHGKALKKLQGSEAKA